MNCTNYGGARRTRQDFAQDLVETQDFVGMIIDDLDQYVDFANILVKKGDLTLENHRTLELGDNHMFPHSKNLQSRLKRLTRLLSYSKTRLTSE